MSNLPEARLAHVGLYVDDLEKCVDWYKKMLGVVETDRGEFRGATLVFTSMSADEHHQVVLISPKPPGVTGSSINQLSFRVKSLADVQAYYRHAKALGANIQRCTNHGNAWSVYIFDPEGNRVEFYTPTPWYVGQPFGETLDLDATEAEIHAVTEKMVKSDPSCVPMAEWSKRTQARLGA